MAGSHRAEHARPSERHDPVFLTLPDYQILGRRLQSVRRQQDRQLQQDRKLGKRPQEVASMSATGWIRHRPGAAINPLQAHPEPPVVAS